MVRTQVSLDAREYELAKKEAEALGVSVAEFVRRAVRDKLPPSGTPRRSSPSWIVPTAFTRSFAACLPNRRPWYPHPWSSPKATAGFCADMT